MNYKPLVSIVTVVYNGEKTIEKTIQSVISNPHFSNIEYIIIDGLSTDGTVKIVKKYAEDITCWISEHDNGIYDAMNKGWQFSRGEYVYFLGADDILLDIPIETLGKVLEQDIGIVYGNVQLTNGGLFISQYNWRIYLLNTLHHQGMFLKKAIVDRVPFNIEYRVFADFDLNQRLYKRKIKALGVKNIITLFNMNGISNNTQMEEYFSIIRKNQSCIIYYVALFCYNFRIRSRIRSAFSCICKLVAK